MKWPPLIDSAALPRWLVARDVLLTLGAWALLLCFVRNLLWMVLYWPLAMLGVDITPRWKPGELWHDTLPFLQIVALLVLWLTIFAIIRWRVLTNRARTAGQPPPLELAAHAETFGALQLQVDQLRGMRTATVETSGSGSDAFTRVTAIIRRGA